MSKKIRMVCASCAQEFYFTPEQLERILAKHEGPRRKWCCRQCVALSYKFDAIRKESDLPEWKRARMVPPGATLESQYRRGVPDTSRPPTCSRCGREVGSSQEQEEGQPILCRTCRQVEQQRFGR
ncbi:MAG: hypothetical protein JW797_07855 [Bradymonadales bacterium]|nr:hypothetical protein [Bradymonadales bacterium]